MRLFPKPLEIGDEEGFTSEKDIFNRKPLGDRMTRLVSEVEDPLMIAFDGQWGSGKTTFLKMWAGELRKAGFPVIFLDAFETDYLGDPFSVLAREIVELSQKSKHIEERVVNKIKEKSAQIGKLLLRTSVGLGAKILIRGASLSLADISDVVDLKESFSEVASAEVDNYIDEIFSGFRAEFGAVHDFRNILSDLPIKIAKGGSVKPVIFIVDELDRCKPTYALQMLERMKHFFLVENVHFVLGVKQAQLESAVRLSYGESVDASDYLLKFINIRILNIENLNYDRGELNKYAEFLLDGVRGSLSERHRQVASVAMEIFIRILRIKGKSFRAMEHAFSLLKLSLIFVEDNIFKDGELIAGLILMKILEPDLFTKAKNGKITYDEVGNFLGFNVAMRSDSGLGEDVWFALLHEEGAQEWKRYSDRMFRFSLRERDGVIPHLANNVIDSFGI